MGDTNGKFVWVGENGAGFYSDLTRKDRKKYNDQRSRCGVGDDETFCLDKTVAVFILPRLRRYREVMQGYPEEMTWERWQGIVDELIWFFEQIINNLDVPGDTDANGYYDRVEKAQKLFGEYFTALWW